MKNCRRSRLLPRRPCHLAQGLLNRVLFPFPRMQPHKSVLLHSHLHPSIFPSAPAQNLAAPILFPAALLPPLQAEKINAPSRSPCHRQITSRGFVAQPLLAVLFILSTRYTFDPMVMTVSLPRQLRAYASAE